MFTSQPNKILYVEDMAKEVDRDARSVSACVYNMRRNVPNMADRITVMVAGRAWRYDDPDVPSVSNAVSQRHDEPTGSVPTAVVNDVPTRLATASYDDAKDDDESGPVATSEPGRMFEELGPQDDGSILVVDERGNPFKLVPLD